MEIFFFEPIVYEKLYNCSFYNIDQVPLKERKHEFFGVVILLSYTVFFVLYCLCMYAMFKTNHRNKASYRLMILLGFMHIVGLQFGGLSTAILAIEGAVFCSHPTIIYWCGQLGLITWCGSTMVSFILGFNRCCELYGGQLALRLFGGRRLWFWLLIPNVYMAYIFFYTKPPLYSGMMMAWFFNPHAGYYDDYGKVYHNNLHSANNLIVCTTESMLYGTLIILYLRATRSISSEMKNAFRREKKIYIQVVLIGIIHFTASFSYVLMQFIPVNFYTTLMASTFYLLSQGFPPVIYLLVNKTLRNIILDTLGLKKYRQSANFTSNGLNQLATITNKKTFTYNHSQNSQTTS